MWRQRRAVFVSSGLLFVGLIIAGMVILMPKPRLQHVMTVNGLADVAVEATAGTPNGQTAAVRASLGQLPLADYDMYWYVGDGTRQMMANSSDGQHKTATIDVGQYASQLQAGALTVHLVAVLRATEQTIYGSVSIKAAAAVTAAGKSDGVEAANAAVASAATAAGTAGSAAPAAKGGATSSPATTAANSANLYVDPDSNAAQTAASTADASLRRIMTKLASVPTAHWFGDWNSDVQADANAYVSAAAAKGQLPVLAAYNIPQRDCGNYSSGGATSAAAYQSWIESFAIGIGNRSALVVLEPDALALTSCLSASDQSQRYSLISSAVSTLKAHSGVRVYIDAGNSNWIGASDMAGRLQQANIARADGFSLNVSNFYTTAQSAAYGNQLSGLVGGKHYVIDTSRNGNGSNGEWCNPSGRALGSLPTNATGYSLADYLLWVKTPGESDGTCNGGPAAGAWWPDYANGLAVAAGW